MSRAVPETSMACPHCGAVDVPPVAGSTDMVSWYVCARCHEEWSVRFRGDCVGIVLIGRDAAPRAVSRTS
jgi:transposase-like protein